MRRKKEFFTPDLTPLIDVVFLLLIFFLVTSVFKKEDMALLLNLPTSKTSTEVVMEKDLDILLSKDKVAFEKEILTFELLDEKLSKITDKKQAINVRIDKEVQYQRIVKILDIFKKYSLTNIALVNQKEK